MSLPLTLQDDMTNVFFNSGFEEDIVYTPSGGAARTIKAVVYRADTLNAASQSPIRNSIRSPDITILISTNTDTGAAVVTPREDKVTLAKRVGEAVETFTVGGIVQSDLGAWLLRLA